MSIRAIFGVLILGGGLVAVSASPTLLLAQSADKSGVAPKDTDVSAPKSVAPNTNTNPTKHRYWRHRGGKHPHFGSRRVRT
ncbi:hypothetical protein [Bradyrhizobium diversitatis]|uniref:Uncharacterized protein n=1 Tax=Bradyrhizobium diversitatis TaxID=2755406 RepID=A0ABS0NUX2_9BRAD|nr:hypothetical protein [Bradyrhizobium diversitatis]KYK46280.1 hypothetical protein A1D31_32805 [Bradyrhizobium liaoningense]MBH5384800.1 hypothetical protein [Bradyrhizobium diversitatis]